MRKPHRLAYGVFCSGLLLIYIFLIGGYKDDQSDTRTAHQVACASQDGCIKDENILFPGKEEATQIKGIFTAKDNSDKPDAHSVAEDRVQYDGRYEKPRLDMLLDVSGNHSVDQMIDSIQKVGPVMTDMLFDV